MKSQFKKRKAGVSMVEVSVAMAITAFTCAGLYTMGLTVRRSTERMRVTTEARSFAKEALEEIIATGMEPLAMPSCTVADAATIQGSTGALIARSVQLLWHDASGVVVTNADMQGYVEVHVNVDYPAPRSGNMLRDTFSTILN